MVGHNISGLSINLTLIPVRAALTSSVPAAFWLSLQPIRGSNAREKEEELVWTHRPRHPCDNVFRNGLSLDTVFERQDQVFCVARNIFCAHRPFHGHEPNHLRCAGTDLLLQDCDWISAVRVCNLYPSDKIAGWCSACEHLGPGERSTARRALAFGGLVPWYLMRRVGRRPLLWTRGKYLRFRTRRTLRVGLRRGWRLLPECARTSASASACCTVPAAVLSARAHPRSLSVSASMVNPQKSPQRVRLALSQGCRENRKRHLRSRRCQLLTAERQAMNPPSVVQNTRNRVHHSGIHFASCSMNPLLTRSVSAQESATAVLLMSAPAKPWEVDAHERSQRAQNLLRSL